jgi:hypothetical protein
MELNISDIDNVNSMNPYEISKNTNINENLINNNYWTKPNIQQKKKKVTFDDILSNMNLVVNQNGVLQFMNIKQDENILPQSQNFESSINNSYNNSNNNSNNNSYDNSNNSYIYNKYFKDYTDPNAKKIGPRVPKTMEEYRKMLLDDKIAAIKLKKHIENVKSKKLIFNANPIIASKNNLRSMNFK